MIISISNTTWLNFKVFSEPTFCYSVVKCLKTNASAQYHKTQFMYTKNYTTICIIVCSAIFVAHYWTGYAAAVQLCNKWAHFNFVAAHCVSSCHCLWKYGNICSPSLYLSLFLSFSLSLSLSLSLLQLLFSTSATSDCLNNAIKTRIFISNMRFNWNFSQYYYNRRAHMTHGALPRRRPPPLHPRDVPSLRPPPLQLSLAEMALRLAHANAIQFDFPIFRPSIFESASPHHFPHFSHFSFRIFTQRPQSMLG